VKKLIHSYLSSRIIQAKGRIYYAHYEIECIVSSNCLTTELSLIFGLNKKQLKWYVKSWVLKQNRNFDFNKFWIPKLIATWSPESIQDLQAFHGIDVEAELTALLAQEIANEIDRDIINTLLGRENSLDSDLIITEDYQMV